MNRIIALIVGLLLVAPALAWFPRGAPVGGGNPPVNITPLACETSTPITNGGNLVTGCTLSASNSPTSWTIVSQSCSSCYSITNSGVIQGGSNAANVGTETDTIVVTASNSAGPSAQTTITISAYADGYVAASTLVSPQFSGNLSGYAARPPWKVAGVDYAVGPRTATTNTPGVTTPPTGMSCNSGTFICTVSGSNVTVQNWDFSVGNGWQLDVSGTGDIVTDNNFVVGSNKSFPISISNSASNTTVQYNTINGNGVLNGGSCGFGLLSSNGKGTTTVQYNWIHTAASEPMVFGTNTADTTQQWIFQYNLVGDGGYGKATTGCHGDWIQTSNATNDTTASVTFNFNFFYQYATYGATGSETQGLSLWSAGGNAGSVVNQTVSYNVFVSTPGGSTGAYVNYAVINIPKNVQNAIITKNNYFDITGIGESSLGLGSWLWNGSGFGSGNSSTIYNATINGFSNLAAWESNGNAFGNINMSTGQPFLMTAAPNAGPSPHPASGN